HSDRRARLARKQILNGSSQPLPESDQHPRTLDGEDRRQSTALRREMAPLPPRQQFDPALVSEFTRRGITVQRAQELLANLKAGQDVVAQLEYFEQEAQRSQTTPWPIKHPDRFIASLIEKNSPIPD